MKLSEDFITAELQKWVNLVPLNATLKGILIENFGGLVKIIRMQDVVHRTKSFQMMMTKVNQVQGKMPSLM